MVIHILIVDDDRDLLVLIERFLQREYPDFETSLAASAQDALRQIESGDFDTVICDFHLGPNEMNGLELLEWLREGGNDIPFIMFTGRSREDVAIRALNLGASFYLKKDAQDFENLLGELSLHIRNGVEAKKMEDALSASDSRFRAVFEHSGYGIMVSTNDGSIVDVNPAFENMIGYREDELLQMNVRDFSFPDDHETDLNLYNEAIKHVYNSYRLEERYLRKDGTTLWGDVSISIVYGLDNKPSFIYAMIQDITERIHVEQNLKSNEEEFKEIFEKSPIAIELFDSKGSLIQANNAALELFGISSIKSIKEFNLFEDANIPSHLRENLRKGIPCRYDYALDFNDKTNPISKTSKSGAINIDVSNVQLKNNDGTIRGYLSHIVDITEHTLSKLALIESETKFRAVFEDAAIGMTIVSLDNELLSFNPAMHHMLGYTQEEMSKMSVSDFSHPDDMKTTRNLSAESISNGTDSYQVEQRYMKKNGETMWGRLTWSLVRNSDNEPSFGIGMVEEITERKLARIALQESMDRYRSLIENMAAVVIELTPDGTLSYISPQCATVFGYKPEDYSKMKPFEFIHQDDRDSVQKRMEVTFKEGVRSNTQFRMRHKKGHYVAVESVGNIIDTGSGPRYIGVVYDTTEIGKWANAYQDSEDYWRTIVENISDQVVVIDTNEVIHYINRSITDTPFEEIIGKSVYAYLSEDHIPAIRNVIQTVTKTNEVVTYEYKNKMHSGQVVNLKLVAYPVLIGKELKWICLSISNLTDLRKNEMNFKAIADFTYDWESWHGTDGSLLWTNPAVEKYTGYSVEECIAMKDFPLPLIHEESREVFKSIVSQNDENYQTGNDVRFRAKKKDGSLIWMAVSWQPISDDSGESLGIRTSIHDISARVATEEALHVSENMYRCLFNGAPLSILLIEPNTGKIIDFNEVAHTSLGYTRDEFERLSICDIDIFLETAEDVLARAEQSGARESDEFESKHQAKDGTVRDVHVSVNRVSLGTEVLSQAFVQDITERNRIQADLQKERDLMGFYLDLSGEIVVALDTDGDISLINKKGCEILECNREEVVGINWFDNFVAKELKESVRHVFNQLIKGDVESARIYENHVITRSGSQRLIRWQNDILRSDDGSIIGVVSSGEDITDIGKAQNALEESEERFSKFAEFFPGPLFIKNEEFNYVYVNNHHIDKFKHYAST